MWMLFSLFPALAKEARVERYTYDSPLPLQQLYRIFDRERGMKHPIAGTHLREHAELIVKALNHE